jgi:hypothetical protein
MTERTSGPTPGPSTNATSTESEPDPRAPADGTDGTDDASPSRRTLVRALLLAGFGVPLVVEGGTLLGMVRGHLAGEPSTPDPVGLGDELLPAAPVPATLADAAVDAVDDRARLVVAVDNAADAPCELAIGPLVTDAGTRIEGGDDGRVSPGASATLSATWTLPAGELPGALHVRSVVGSEVVERDVELGTLPIARR